MFVRPDELDVPLTFEGTRAAGATLGSGVVMVFDETRRPGRRAAAHRRVLPRRVVRPVRARAGSGTVRQEEVLRAPARAAAARAAARASWRCSRELGQVMRDASICGLGQTASSAIESALARLRPVVSGRTASMTATRHLVPAAAAEPAARAPARAEPPRSSSTIDGEPVEVPAGRDASSTPAARAGIDDADALLPRDPHAGQRLPGLRRRGRGRARAGPGLLAQGRAGHGRADRLASGCAQSRKLVLEFLASSVDLSTAPAIGAGALRRRPERYGPRRRRAASATPRARPSPRPTARAETVAQPVKVDNDLYVRDYSQVHPLLQVRRGLRHRRAEHLRDRGRRARLRRAHLDRVDVPLPDSACVYCGNCIGVCPTGALMFKSEYDMREAGHVGRDAPDAYRHDLLLLRRRLHAHAARAGQRHREGHLAADSTVTQGHLCIKGRFGFTFVEGPESAKPGPS